MNQISLLVIGILFIGFTASAQRGNGGDGNDRAAKQAKALKEELKLTDVQFEKMTALNKVQTEKWQQMRSTSSEDRMQMRETMKANREKYEADVKAILTPEQFVKYQETMAERKEQMKNGGRSNGQRADAPRENKKKGKN